MKPKRSQENKLKKMLLELNAEIQQPFDINDFEEQYRQDIVNIVLLLNVVQNLMNDLIGKIDG
jgi:hypothetical protein